MQLPMLANKYNETKATWPAYIQPKLDGVRCLHSNEETYTRNQKPHAEHIRKLLLDRLNFLRDGRTLDGELMLAGCTFQGTVSAVKKDGVKTHLLEYHVYDFMDDGPFRERKLGLPAIGCPRIIPVQTLICLNAKQFKVYAQRFIKQGYEGAIYRSRDGLYKHGRSGRDLLKYKEFQDAEFAIVGYNEGQGKDAGTPVFVCMTADDQKFCCRPKGGYEYRRKLWADRESLTGKLLTVRFQELTDSGVPRFPVGVEIRNYE